MKLYITTDPIENLEIITTIYADAVEFSTGGSKILGTEIKIIILK